MVSAASRFLARSAGVKSEVLSRRYHALSDSAAPTVPPSPGLCSCCPVGKPAVFFEGESEICPSVSALVLVTCLDSISGPGVLRTKEGRFE